jgi:hypothetical protein
MMIGTAGCSRILIAMVLAACVGMPARAQTPGSVIRLSWLAGCWNSESKEAGSSEQWMQPAGGTMLGIGRTVKSGATTEFEFMRVHEAPDGKLLFTAIPSGQMAATFTQLRLSDSEIVFENATHDFPQRVMYRRDGDARLVASIEGTRNGKTRRIEFPMRRAQCER